MSGRIVTPRLNRWPGRRPEGIDSSRFIVDLRNVTTLRRCRHPDEVVLDLSGLPPAVSQRDHRLSVIPAGQLFRLYATNSRSGLPSTSKGEEKAFSAKR